MARVRSLERADLAPEHQPLYDEIAARRGGLPPNFKAATFQTVQHRLEDAGVIDLLMLIGYYYSLAHTMAALEVGPPPGVPSTLVR